MITIKDPKAFPIVTFSLRNRLFLRIVNHFERRISLSYPFDCETAHIENYYCNYCNFQTELKLLFKQHVEEYHIDKINRSDLLIGKHSIQTYICEKCSFETNFLIKWRQHTTQCEEKEKNRQMYKCDESESLKHHKITNHHNDDEIQWYHCNSCSYQGKSKNLLREHIKLRHQRVIKWYECKKCTYKVESLQNLNIHIAMHNFDKQDITWYECKECSYKSKRKKYLSDHMKKHDVNEQNVKWYECEKCPFKAKFPTSLKLHMNLQHVDEENVERYQCEKCPFKTHYKPCLTIHTKRAHLNNKTQNIQKVRNLHRCEKCPLLTFNNRSSLKSHINSQHMHKKIIRCEKCPFETRRPNSLQLHIILQHSDDL